MCIFCEIIKGNIPCYKVYEDDVCLAFLDISQATIGHTLIVPKNHYQNVFELDENTASHLGKVVIKIAANLKEKLNLEALNILNNNGEKAGQTVNHFHIHLIPRYNNDDLTIIFNSNELNKEDFNNLLDKIKM